MKKTASVKWLLAAALVIQLLFASAAAASPADTINWGEEVSATYDKLHPHTLNWSGDVMKDGGLNLSTLKVTAKSAEADIVINQYGSMGANGILELDEDLQDPTDPDLTGFTNSVTIKKGAVYLIVLHDGTYAKLRIDRYLPETGLSISKVYFTYVLETEYVEEYEDESDYSGTWEDDWEEWLDIGDPLKDWDAAEDVYEFEEGAITLPWNALEGHVSWDLFRSDNGNPYVKMTDFRLAEPTFTDKYTIAGHVYLYKFVAYNSKGEAVYMSPAVIVSIVEEASGSGNVIVLQLDSTTASVNGKAVKLDVAPFLKDGRTLVPLRFVTESLGANLEWNDMEKSITLRRGTDKMVLVLDSSKALINGQTVYMDVPAINHKGRTMVPIRFVIENFNLEIEFDDKTRQITIMSKSDETELEEEYAPESPDADDEAPGTDTKEQSSADAFIGKWAMWVPGTGISTGEGGQYLPGADAGTLTIYADGSYTYPWNGKLLSGTWEATSEANQIVLVNYKFESDWTLTLTEDGGVRANTSPGLLEDGTRIE